MAEGTKLVIDFIDSDGKTAQFSFNYAKPSPALADVKALMAGMITNTQIYEKALISAKSAKTVTTTENVLDISDNISGTYNANPPIPDNATATTTQSVFRRS